MKMKGNSKARASKNKKIKLHVRTDDLVQVISGKSKGQTGKVAAVSVREGKVIVEGVNVATKHLKPRQEGTVGSIVKVSAPLYASKVMLICPKCNKPTRIAHGFDENNKKMRKCKHCANLF